jgi:uncharacterized SAM-binding protein YcdF (DUF218 family)
MISHLRNTAGSWALETADAVGWGWTGPVTSANPTRRIWLRRTVLACVLLSAFAGLIGFVGFLGFVYSLDRVERRPEVRTDGIVAMTGGSQRIGDAIDLLAQGYASRLLISGVNERTSRDEIARLNPGQRRLFDCCVDLDYRARNTIGNAIETRRWAEQNRFRSVIVVTSNYHMPRTLVELDHALPGIRKVPYAVVTPTVDPDLWWRSPATAKVLLSEYVKLLVVWLRTRFESDPERSTAAIVMSGGMPIKAVGDPLTR